MIEGAEKTPDELQRWEGGTVRIETQKKEWGAVRPKTSFHLHAHCIQPSVPRTLRARQISTTGGAVTESLSEATYYEAATEVVEATDWYCDPSLHTHIWGNATLEGVKKPVRMI